MVFLPDTPVQQEQVIPIVVGAHLCAELNDRRHASFLHQSIHAWMQDHELVEPPWPLVCSDLWYLNDSELRIQPTICVGHPDVNAATAAFSSRLETSRLEDGLFRIQLDPSFVELKCCIWGIDTEGTRAGMDCFVSEYLPPFLGSIFGIIDS